MAGALFELNPAESDLSDIDATHAWGLPGVQCDRCGAWSNVGLSYPAVDLSGNALGDLLREPHLAPLEEYLSLKDRVASQLPPGTMLLPGTEFGPLFGTMSSKTAPLAWLNPWTPLLDRELAGRLSDAGLELPALVPPKLRTEAGWNSDLGELALEPVAILSDASFEAPVPAACDLCGRRAPRRDGDWIARPTDPPADIFRAAEWTTLVIATERMVEALHAEGALFEARALRMD